MFVEQGAKQGETTNQERRDRSQPESRLLGHVVGCDGARATLAADGNITGRTAVNLWTVGKMISINLGSIRTVGLVYSIEQREARWNEDGTNPIAVSLELIGEVRDTDRGPVFDRGITTYPHIGAPAHPIRARDLQAVYDLAGRHSVAIGHLSQDEEIEAYIAIDDILSRHFAVVGTTGVGKSTAISLFLRKAIGARPELRV